jgi:hypothetical protein
MTFVLNAQSIGEDILRDAADQAAIFDPDLAATLEEMASDYAGPWHEQETNR